MRDAFADEMTSIAAVDRRLVLLSGDVGNRLFDRFKATFPERFLNCGVAEANMTGLAAGMALCGLRPVTYAIASFAVARCLEQIRVDLCFHDLPVIIAGLGGGLPYASDGATHFACEDIAFARALPNMTVLCPGDPWEVRQALRAALDRGGPTYLRLGKKGEPTVERPSQRFAIGEGAVIRAGHTICLLSAGNVLPIVVAAAAQLADRGASPRVVSVHTIKPLDDDLLSETFASFELVVTIEEHGLAGGFGGAVAEWLADRPPRRARLLRIGTPDSFSRVAGKHEDARRMYGLTAEGIADTTMRAWQDTRIQRDAAGS